MSTTKLERALEILEATLEHPNAGADDRRVLLGARAELAAIRKAAKVLQAEDVSGFIYDVRDRAASDTSFAGNTWEHPRVVAYGEAAAVITSIAKESP